MKLRHIYLNYDNDNWEHRILKSAHSWQSGFYQGLLYIKEVGKIKSEDWEKAKIKSDRNQNNMYAMAFLVAFNYVFENLIDEWGWEI